MDNDIERLLCLIEKNIYSGNVEQAKIMMNNIDKKKYYVEYSYLIGLINEHEAMASLDDKKLERYAECMNLGKQALLEKEYTEAYKHFLAGYEATKINIFYYYIGKAFFGLGNWVKPVDQKSADHEGDAETKRIAQKHQDAPDGGTLLRGKHQGGTKESTYARGPSNGKDDSEKQRGEKTGFFYGKILSISFVQRIDPDPPQEVQSKDNHDKPGNQIDYRAVALQDEPETAGEGAEGYKHKSKSADKAQSIYQGCFF